MMQLTEMELLLVGQQLRAEALAIAKYDSCSQQSNDPRLQQMYATAADRHRSHYETLMRQVQSFAPQRQF